MLPPLTAPHLHKDRNRILEKYIEIRKNDKYIQAGLRKIVQALPSPSLEVKYGSEKEVNTYIEFLVRLSIPKSRIILWYYPDRRSSETERESIRKWWSKETGIPVNRILQKSLSHARFSVNPEERIGWVSIFVREAKHESTNKSSGVQQALHLLTVFTYDRL